MRVQLIPVSPEEISNTSAYQISFTKEDLAQLNKVVDQLMQGSGPVVVEVTSDNPPPETQPLRIENLRERSREERVSEWMSRAFDKRTVNSVEEQCYRVLESALRLVKGLGLSFVKCQRVLTHVFWDHSKPDVYKEYGGALVSIASLNSLLGFDNDEAFKVELHRLWASTEHEVARRSRKKIRHDYKTPSTPEEVELVMGVQPFNLTFLTGKDKEVTKLIVPLDQWPGLIPPKVTAEWHLRYWDVEAQAVHDIPFSRILKGD